MTEMNKKLSAYLAHPWKSETHGAAKVVEHELELGLPNLAVVNPFWCGDLTEQWMKNKESVTIAKAIVRKDLELIQECDFMIVYYPDTCGTEQFYGGFGTPMEIFYATHNLMKRVYALTPFSHPWLKALGVKCYTDIYEMIEEIKREWKL